MKAPGIDAERLQNLVRSRDDALAAVRKAALERFLETNLPSTRKEEWKYTNLAPIAASSDAWLGGASAREAAPEPEFDTPPVDAHWLTISNGHVTDDSLDAFEAAVGSSVRVSRLSAETDARPMYTGDALSSLNAALMHDALRIEIRAGAVLDKPIGLRLLDFASGNAATSQTRLIVLAGSDSEAEIVEWQASSGDAEHFAGVVTEIDLDENATLSMARVQERSTRHSVVSRVQASLRRNSVFRHAAIELGGRLVRTDIEGRLQAPGSRFEAGGVLLADAEEHMDSHVTAVHDVGPTVSRQHYRGIAGGRARCVFNGKALVREGADGTDAEQSSHNLLLSERAEIDTKPELEIYAEDVKCSHGATVGRLDRQALFYLLSRGIGRADARRLLIRAFAAQVLADFPVEVFREFAGAATDRKLSRLVEGAGA